MSNRLQDIFRPELKLINVNVYESNPCNNCETDAEWNARAIYGSPAEREDAVLNLPEECKTCLKRSRWLVDCLTKLKWYENNDVRFNMSLEELKKIAGELGYSVVKKRQPLPKLERCSCGANRRMYGIRSASTYKKPGIFYKCEACGLEGKSGMSKREAIENWNRAVLESKDEVE